MGAGLGHLRPDGRSKEAGTRRAAFDCEEARRREYQAVVDSIRFTREELGVGQ